ncbi:MAG: universal stress protein [Bryobacteraceae bacterium]
MFAIKKILFPVDFSDRCQGAARYVEAIAARFKAEVHLLHVVEPLPEPAGIPISEWVESRRESLERQYKDEFPFVKLVQATSLGDPAYHIIEYANQHGIDLIMMPTHGWGPYRRFLLGSVTAKVLHDAKCPVWTGVHLEQAPPIEEIAFRKLVAAVDLGAHSGAILSWTKAFAEEYGGEVVVAHAVPGFDTKPEIDMDQEFSSELARRAKEELAKVQAGSGTAWPMELASGDPAHVLGSIAKQFGADLMVIGRSELHGLGRLRASGYSIIRNAPCPVISV